MGSAKKIRRASLLPAWLKRLAAYLWGPGRPLAVAALMIAGLSAGTAAVWTVYVYPHYRDSGLYSVTQDKVVITPPKPEWIRADIRAEVFRNASLDAPPSNLEDDLTDRIRRAFLQHPWVANVVRVKRRAPAGVEIELVYRRPVCMVDQPGGLLPVDVEGVLLPSDDFSIIEKNSYPRLSGVDTAPRSLAGQPWGDERVAGGAEIAAALADVWRQLKLERIVASPRAASAVVEPTYQLLTRGGTRIAWGLAPSSKGSEEIPAAEKVARLLQYVADRGSLDGRDGPQELDVRALPPARGKP